MDSVAQVRTKIFLDTEITDLSMHADPISIALVAEDNTYFYAEFNDFDPNKITDTSWMDKNVFFKLKFKEPKSGEHEYYTKSRTDKDIPLTRKSNIEMRGSTKEIEEELRVWINQFIGKVEIWADLYVYDWIIFRDIVLQSVLPQNVYYIPFDICTLLEERGIDPDIDREKLIDLDDINSIYCNGKHNALWDAITIKKIHKKFSTRNIVPEKRTW